MSSDSEFFDELEDHIERLHALVRLKKANRRRRKAAKRRQQSDSHHLGGTKSNVEQSRINNVDSAELLLSAPPPKRQKLTFRAAETRSERSFDSTPSRSAVALPALEDASNFCSSNSDLVSSRPTEVSQQQRKQEQLEQELDQCRRPARTGRRQDTEEQEAPEPKKTRKKRVSDTLLDTPKAVLHPTVVVTVAPCDEKRKLPTECRTLFLLAAKILAQHGSVIDRDKAYSAEDTTGTTYAELLTALMLENDLPEKYRNSVNRSLELKSLQISSCSPIKAMVSAMSRRTGIQMIRFHIDGQLHSLQKSRSMHKRAVFRLLRDKPKAPPTAKSTHTAEKIPATVATEVAVQGLVFRVKQEHLRDFERCTDPRSSSVR
ncbi:MAG: hypothetical protein MHM6MM_006958 [Cercozoa sp. M6MM]